MQLFFTLCVIGLLITYIQKNEPPSIKILDLRVKNSFDLRVGNSDFCQKSRENTNEFLSGVLKMAAKNNRGKFELSSFFFKWSTIGKS